MSAGREKRFACLAGLERGWLDGEGEPISAAVLSQGVLIAEVIEAAAPGLAYGIFPTPSGGLVFEWIRNQTMASVELGSDLAIEVSVVSEMETL